MNESRHFFTASTLPAGAMAGGPVRVSPAHRARLPWLHTHTLQSGQPLRLDTPPAEAPQLELQVVEGRLWVTSSNEVGEAPHWWSGLQLTAAGDTPDAHDVLDHWLVAGDTLVLPAATRVVLEAWPTARFLLLAQTPQVDQATS